MALIPHGQLQFLPLIKQDMTSTGRYSHVIEWLWVGFRLVIWFTEHVQIVTKINYSAIANSHTLQFTVARTMSSQSAVSSPVVAWWQISTMSSASVLKFLPGGNCLTTNSCSNSAAYSISARTAWKTSIFCCVRFCWDAHVIATQPLPNKRPFFTEPLLTNGCCITVYLAAVAYFRRLQVGISKHYNIVVDKPVAMQQPRDEQLCNDRC
jgi:hypothetical protein